MAPRTRCSVSYLKACFECNAENGDLTWKHRPRSHFPSDKEYKRWNRRWAEKRAGKNKVDATNKYPRVKINNAVYMMHHIVWALSHGRWSTKQIDHKHGRDNGNGIANLREATPRQNAFNRPANKNRPADMKGITAHGRKHQARIGIRGKLRHLGTFDNVEDAKAAYRKEALIEHGEFAYAH